ncbi:MAG: hypothetical protein R3Y57_06955 [Erysipelotrichaceae bacterium]
MNFEKIHLDDIRRCYCASHMDIDGKLVALFASEDPQNICNGFYGEGFKEKMNLWDDAGGCMSIIPFKNRKNEFLAVQEFYLKVSPSLSKLVWGKYSEETGWQFKDFVSLPFLHRFDIYDVEGKEYLVCATIARNKENKEDWSQPGQIYVGEIPTDLNEGITLNEIADGCFKNHGYSRGMYEGKVCGYFASEQGVRRLTPPSSSQTDWKIEKIMEGSISEIAFADIDNDGVEEMMTIEPFHGNIIKIYKLKDGEYKEVFNYPTEIDFAHALVGGKVCGINSFLVGVRRVESELAVVQCIHGEYQVTIIEKGVGPANIDLVNLEDCDLILSANHSKDEAAIYIARK